VTVATGAEGGGATAVTVACSVRPSIVSVFWAVQAVASVSRAGGCDRRDGRIGTRPRDSASGENVPFPSLALAESCMVVPASIRGATGLMLTLAIAAGGGTVTITIAFAALPSLAAVMMADLGAWPVTSPARDTLATPVGLPSCGEKALGRFPRLERELTTPATLRSDRTQCPESKGSLLRAEWTHYAGTSGRNRQNTQITPGEGG
jgi:hypothetical protein